MLVSTKDKSTSSGQVGVLQKYHTKAALPISIAYPVTLPTCNNPSLVQYTFYWDLPAASDSITVSKETKEKY